RRGRPASSPWRRCAGPGAAGVSWPPVWATGWPGSTSAIWGQTGHKGESDMARTPDLELGHGVSAVYTSWGPHEVAGLIEYHLCAGGNCRDPQTGGPGRCG